MQIQSSHLVLDACCILNFCASGYFLEILQSIPAQVVVTEVVKARELLTLQQLNEENQGAIQFQEAISKGLLLVVDFESETEQELFLNYAFELGDDGESATCAIAIQRRWAIATDDKKAISFCKQKTSQVQILSTLEIVKYWSEKANISSGVLREALTAIRTKGRYIPNRNHPLLTWWKQIIE
jgi:predicted nucleic acid-binding protein